MAAYTSMHKLTSNDLGDYLLSKGVSQAGVRSVRENGITGEMLMDFCEEDIKDAFTLFKDRFITRKLIRERKSAKPSIPCSLGASRMTSTINLSSQTNFPRYLSPSPLTPHYHSTDSKSVLDNVSSSLRQFQQQYESPSYNMSNYRKHSPPAHDYLGPTNLPNMNHEKVNDNNRGEKWNIEKIKTEPQMFTFCNPSRINTTITNRSEVLSVTNTSRQTAPTVRSPLMHQTVSSTNEDIAESYRIQRTISGQDDLKVSSHNDTVDKKQVIDLSVRNDDFENPLRCPQSSSSSSLSLSSSLSSPTEKHLNLTLVDDTDKQLETTLHMVTLDEKLRVKKYTAEQLLCKKSIRGRPNEAQHLGTLAIRNAAQSARLWDSAPLIKDISREQKDIFIKFILAFAPQLSERMELVWVRLREALQNRRKYLSDKETGKRILKRSSTMVYPMGSAAEIGGPSSPTRLKIKDVGSLIDLTD